MKCDHCDNEATVHEVIRRGGKTIERHLCEQCAKQHGVAVQHVPINELIQKYVLQQAGEAGAGASEVRPGLKACASCGLHFAEFRSSGVLGCPDCYQAFEAALTPLLERTHEGGTRHVGKTPRRLSASPSAEPGAARPGSEHSAERAEKLRILNRQLEEAVRGEQYERAAALRDEIRRVARGGDSPAGDGGAPA